MDPPSILTQFQALPSSVNHSSELKVIGIGESREPNPKVVRIRTSEGVDTDKASQIQVLVED
jgi:hypothetical protein